MQRPLPPAPIGDFPDFGIRLTPAPDVWEWLQAEILAGGYVYMQPTVNVVTTNLAVGEVIEMVSAVDIVGSLRGILAWEAELIITKPFSGTSTRSNVHRHLNRTKRQACDRVGNRVVERRAAYLRGYGALFNGERQHSTIQALPWLAGCLFSSLRVLASGSIVETTWQASDTGAGRQALVMFSTRCSGRQCLRCLGCYAQISDKAEAHSGPCFR